MGSCWRWLSVNSVWSHTGQCRAGSVCLASCSGWQMIPSVHEHASSFGPKGLHKTAAACSLPQSKLYNSDICCMTCLQLILAHVVAVTDSWSFGKGTGDVDVHNTALHILLSSKFKRLPADSCALRLKYHSPVEVLFSCLCGAQV